MSVHEAPAVRAFPEGFWAEHRKGFVIATIAAPLLALLGALGTDQIPFLPRLLYWLILMETGALIGLGVSTGVRAWGRLTHVRWAEILLISLAIALPMTLVIIAMSGMFFGMPTPDLTGLLWIFGVAIIVCATITALNYAVQHKGRILSTTEVLPLVEPQAQTASYARLLDRLPPPHRAGPVHALEAEDHYLRVHTPAGSTLILMRLSDAIAELDGTDGAQTHRSWWVARAAIDRIERGDGRATLHLPGNVAAPVSRTHYRNLRDAGWF